LKEEKSSENEDKILESWMLSTIREKELESVNQLVKLALVEGFDEEKTISEISRLQKLGKLGLEPSKQEVLGLRRALFSSAMLWYWEVVIFSTVAIASVLTISPSSFPVVYVRWTFGLAMLFYIPGFCFVKVLFLKKPIEWLENIIWSVSLSLILVILVALFWNFTPLGLSEVPIVVTLAIFSVACASAAVLNENSKRRD